MKFCAKPGNRFCKNQLALFLFSHTDKRALAICQKSPLVTLVTGFKHLSLLTLIALFAFKIESISIIVYPNLISAKRFFSRFAAFPFAENILRSSGVICFLANSEICSRIPGFAHN